MANNDPCEIHALRKANKHKEALDLARQLHNDWLANTIVIDLIDVKDPLSWCLYDEVKRLRQSGKKQQLEDVQDELSAIITPKDEELAIVNIDKIIESRVTKEANKLSEDGGHTFGLDRLRPILISEYAPQHVAETFGWITYRKLKHDWPDHSGNPGYHLSDFIQYWKESFSANAILFKCLLIQANRHARRWDGYIDFIETLRLHRLRVEDFTDQSPGKYDPFQNQLLEACHHCLETHPEGRKPRPLLHQWLDAWWDSFSEDEEYQYYLARILLWTNGEKEKAQASLIKSIQRQPNDCKKWQALAEIYTGAAKKAALSRSIVCTNQDPVTFIPALLNYAFVLADEGETTEASASYVESIRQHLALAKTSKIAWPGPIEFPEWYNSEVNQTTFDIYQYAQTFAAQADVLVQSYSEPKQS